MSANTIDGLAEQDYILSATTGIGGLLGGQVWEGEVPPGVTLARDTSRLLLPYAVVHFGTPVAFPQGRGLLGEETQPHLLGWRVHVHASTAADRRVASAAIFRKAITLTPSASGNATQVKAVGGQDFGRRDDSGGTSLLTRVLFFECVIGLTQ